MWNPFKRHRAKKAPEMLDSLTSIIATIWKLEKAGLIYWQVNGKTLLIELSLATTLLAGGSKLFQKFLDIAAQIQNSELLADAYEQQRITIETAAVRDAQEKTSSKLTDADIQRIRLNARENMKHIDMKSILDAIHEFDIMIIRSSAISADATQEGGELVAVGHFDGEKVEMAMWDEIKNDLKEEK